MYAKEARIENRPDPGLRAADAEFAVVLAALHVEALDADAQELRARHREVAAPEAVEDEVRVPGEPGAVLFVRPAVDVADAAPPPREGTPVVRHVAEHELRLELVVVGEVSGHQVWRGDHVVVDQQDD